MIQREKDRLECLRLAMAACQSHKMPPDKVTELAEKFYSWVVLEPPIGRR